MSKRRAQRVGSQIVQALGGALGRGLSDPLIGLVTFTDAVVNDDLSTARVFYSVLGDEQAREECREGLKRANGFLRREVAAVLSLRYAPELRFEFDESLTRAARIDSILAAQPPAQNSDEADAAPDAEHPPDSEADSEAESETGEDGSNG
ncbi:MAG: ribosome-binding factor A [Hyphomicrobiaceae bacterium]|jgi:ribosome-binding factor A